MRYLPACPEDIKRIGRVQLYGGLFVCTSVFPRCFYWRGGVAFVRNVSSDRTG